MSHDGGNDATPRRRIVGRKREKRPWLARSHRHPPPCKRSPAFCSSSQSKVCVNAAVKRPSKHSQRNQTRIAGKHARLIATATAPQLRTGLVVPKDSFKHFICRIHPACRCPSFPMTKVAWRGDALGSKTGAGAPFGVGRGDTSWLIWCEALLGPLDLGLLWRRGGCQTATVSVPKVTSAQKGRRRRSQSRSRWMSNCPDAPLPAPSVMRRRLVRVAGREWGFLRLEVLKQAEPFFPFDESAASPLSAVSRACANASMPPCCHAPPCSILPCCCCARAVDGMGP